MKKSRIVAVVCFVTIVFSMLNINVSHAAVKKAKLQKITLEKKQKKEKMTFKISSFVKKNVSFSFDAKKQRGILKFKKIHAKSFRQRLKNVTPKMNLLMMEKFARIKYKVTKKKKQRYGKATVYIYSNENGIQTMKKTKTGLSITLTNGVEPQVTESPSSLPIQTPQATEEPTPDIITTMDPNDRVSSSPTIDPWTPNPKVFPTFELSEISGKKLMVRSEDYYHKIIVPSSTSASATYSYDVNENVYTTKVQLEKMDKTFADMVEINNGDLLSVECKKTADNTVVLTILSNKRIACYAVRSEEGLQIWTSPYVPQQMYHNSYGNQAKMIIEGMTINSVMSAGNYDIKYSQPEDRTSVTITGGAELLPFVKYDMAYENSKISRIIIEKSSGMVTANIYFTEPMYVRVKNNLNKNKCTMFFYNDTKMTKNYSVVLDAGHGGKDNGATATFKNSDGEYITVDEKTINLDVILRANSLLAAKGIPTVLTRDSDKYVSLQDRVKIANKSKAKMFVSVHQNSHDTTAAKGTETYYCAGYTPNKNGGFDSKTLAERIQEQLIITLDRDTDILDRGVKTANFYVIKNTNMPAILAELAFISNEKDRKCLMNDEFRQKAAQAIANSIEMEFFK